MNENRKKLNCRSSRQSRERTELTEKFLKDLEEFLSRDYILNVVADRISEEYAAAPDDYEPTDEDLEEQAKEEAEFRRDIIREKKYKTDFSIYMQLLDSAMTKQIVLKKPAETEQDITPSKLRRIIAWLKNHPHSYGLTGGVIFLILFFVLGFFKAQWRPWCWGTAVIALLVLILSLLGGRSG